MDIWPYENDNEENNHENTPRIDTNELESFFNKSGFSSKSPAINFDEMFASPSFSMNDFDISTTTTNDFLFDTSSTSYKNYGNDLMLMTPQRDRIDDAMDVNWLEDVFTSLDLEYNDKPTKSQNNRRDTIDDIFRSPPNRLSLQRKFTEARFQRQSFEDVEEEVNAANDSKNISLWTTFAGNNNDSVFDTSFDLF